MFKVDQIVNTLEGFAKVVRISLMDHGYGVKWYATGVIVKTGKVVFFEATKGV